nr:hypothetical protein [Oxalobacteraceae bacterium]
MSEEDIKKMIIQHEGIRNQPYKDSEGLWTVGIGHLIGDGKTLPAEWNRTFSNEEVMALFEKDYKHHKSAAESNTPNFRDMTSLGQAAFTDLTFNMGYNWLSKWTNTKKAVESKNNEAIASGLENSLWYKQVGNRAPTIVGLARESFAQDGAVLSGPQSGYKPNLTMHGTEAIIPLKDQQVPVEIKLDSSLGQTLVTLKDVLSALVEGQQVSTDILERIEAASRNTASASEKTARYAGS